MTFLGSWFLFGSFLAMALLLAALCVFHVRRLALAGALTPSSERGLVAGLFVWLISWGLLGASGALSSWNTALPRVVLAMPVLFGVTLLLGLSRLGGVLSRHSSYALLVGVQVFRVPLELIMYRAHVEGVMPVQMSFAGYNYDVITGLSAASILWWSRRNAIPIWLVWGFNVLGTSLLLVILTIAVTSMPMIAAFGPDRLNTWITHFPYVYLAAVMVPLALLGHVLSFRKLLWARATNAATERPGRSPNRLGQSET